LALVEKSGAHAIKLAEAFCQPMQTITSKAKIGYLPAHQSLLEFKGENVLILAVKLAENRDELIIRLYSLSDETEFCRMTLPKNLKTAYLVDLHEKALSEGEQLAADIKIDLSNLSYRHPARAIITLRISFY